MVEQDPNWSHTNLTIDNFDIQFQKQDIKVARLGADDVNLDGLRARGGKLLTWHGGNDPLILPYGSWEYWARVFDHYGAPTNTDDFFRAFFFPGVGHCGGGAAPQPPNMFNVLVDWVENGVAPDYLIGTQNLGGGVTRTRKICKYPNEAVYGGTDSTDDHVNFQCVVNERIPADLQAYMQSAPRFRQAGSAVPVATRIDWQLAVLTGVQDAESYAEQLAGVRDKLAAGKTRAACGQLQAYLNHVTAQAGKQLETLLVDSMLGVGDSVYEDLGCTRASPKPVP